jgi:hypothetical protein
METTSQDRYVDLTWLGRNFPFVRRTWMKWAEDGKLRGAFKVRVGREPGRWCVPLSSALALMYDGVDPRPKDSPGSTTTGEEREARLDREPVLAEL